MSIIEPIKWDKDQKILEVLDQRELPNVVVYLRKSTVEEVYNSIKDMELRGAPLIGVAAAYGVVIGMKNLSKKESIVENVKKSVDILKKARPTAINLFWALDRMLKKSIEVENTKLPIFQQKKLIEEEANNIFKEDEEGNLKIGRYFLENGLITNGDVILTHCNAGALATSKYGTATAPIYLSKEKGWDIKVFVDETRPYLQGARLTAFELIQSDIEVTLICDNMAGWVMKNKMVDKVIVGADRIAINGDTANKIGTYSLALIANQLKIPFFVAAPSSTIDLTCKSGELIPIEEREPQEITVWNGKQIAPERVNVYNPAFDVTPNELISAIVTEKGILTQPYEETIKKLFS